MDNIKCACNDNMQKEDGVMNTECFGQKVCVAYAYVVPQIMNKTYEPDEALSNGTMFPELNIPLGCYVPNEDTGGNENG